MNPEAASYLIVGVITMNSVFSNNLRRLRQSKGYTQEQVADHLGVSPQSVSRWECGATFPDILLPPAIAEHYCVTVDDLFREGVEAYPNYARRLLAVFSSTLTKEDFQRADREFQKMFANGTRTSEDLRSYGVLHEIAMLQCMDQALLAYNEVISRGPEKNENLYRRTQLQRIHLLSHGGRDDLNLERQKKMLTEQPDDPWSHILMLAALDFAGRYEDSYELFKTAVQRFQSTSELYVFGAGACKRLGRPEEAIQWLDKGLEIDPDLIDAYYTKAECYEKMGDWVKAADAWDACAVANESRGFTIEAEEPRKKAAECRAKIGT